MGKGEVMPKRNQKSKKRSKKIHFSDAEKHLVELQKISESGGDDASVATSLRMWWLEHKSWTPKQWNYIAAIVTKNKKPKKKRKASKYYLYAISAGQAIKLGYSSNIKNRIKAMQTGQHEDLKCEWQYYVGTSKAEAGALEKKLHRYCKRYHVRGEWYKKQCMHIVEQFKIKRATKRNYEEEREEMNILLDANERI